MTKKLLFINRLIFLELYVESNISFGTIVKKEGDARIDECWNSIN